MAPSSLSLLKSTLISSGNLLGDAPGLIKLNLRAGEVRSTPTWPCCVPGPHRRPRVGGRVTGRLAPTPKESLLPPSAASGGGRREKKGGEASSLPIVAPPTRGRRRGYEDRRDCGSAKRLICEWPTSTVSDNRFTCTTPRAARIACCPHRPTAGRTASVLDDRPTHRLSLPWQSVPSGRPVDGTSTVFYSQISRQRSWRFSADVRIMGRPKKLHRALASPVLTDPPKFAIFLVERRFLHDLPARQIERRKCLFSWLLVWFFGSKLSPISPLLDERRSAYTEEATKLLPVGPWLTKVHALSRSWEVRNGCLRDA